MQTAIKTTRILVAEDNPGDVRLIRLALSETSDWPVSVTLARDGEEAISILESTETESPDLLILDFNLPKRSGIYVLKMIRKSERLKHLAVIVLSSSPEYFLREKFEDAKLNPTCYFTKPFDFEKFVELGQNIRRCYESRRPVE
jgi:CheY-like chemotaxis protein